MTRITFASIAAIATALMGTPIQAEAGHRHHDDDDDAVIAAVGGFVGGVILGAAIANHNPPPPPPIYVERTHGYGHHHGCRHGRWETVKVRVWVPGHWAYLERDCGRPRKVWVDGHYDYRRERVWVAKRGHRCDRRCH